MLTVRVKKPRMVLDALEIMRGQIPKIIQRAVEDIAKNGGRSQYEIGYAAGLEEAAKACEALERHLPYMPDECAATIRALAIDRALNGRR